MEEMFEAWHPIVGQGEPLAWPGEHIIPNTKMEAKTLNQRAVHMVIMISVGIVGWPLLGRRGLSYLKCRQFAPGHTEHMPFGF